MPRTERNEAAAIIDWRFHYTPKPLRQLAIRKNLAERTEIEFSVLSRSCLRQRLPDEDALRREVIAFACSWTLQLLADKVQDLPGDEIRTAVSGESWRGRLDLRSTIRSVR